MVMKMMRIVGLDSDLRLRSAEIHVLKHMCRMMINDNYGLGTLNRLRLGGFAGRGFQEFAETRDLIDPQVRTARAPEQFALGSDTEGELLAPLWLYLTEMLNQFDGVSPAHAPRQFAVQQILMEDRKLVVEMLTHGYSLVKPVSP